jgi:RimJ/RimL family protein N-acetyltransferase
MTFPELLETDRLVLSRLRDIDCDAMTTIWSDPDVWRALRPDSTLDPDFGRARSDHHLRHWQEHRFGRWIARMRDSGEVAGWIGPSHPDWLPELSDAVEIAWTLRRPFWGRGLASEGAAAAVGAAFAHLEIDEVISLIHHSNRRSLAVAARLGMRHTRDVRDPQFGELCAYALSRERFSPAPPAPRSG